MRRTQTRATALAAAGLALVAAQAGAPTEARAVSAVTTCGMSGTTGNPRVSNERTRDPNTVRTGASGYNYIYGGRPEYTCFNSIYVHVRVERHAAMVR